VAAGPFKIGCVHVWSYAGEQYQNLLTELLFAGPLKDTDALLLDLRDGLGGASPAYLNLFNRDIPQLVMKKPRSHESLVLDQQWRRPVALLINQRVRSGKEAFAWGFRATGRGPVVGQTTAGAVVAGALHFLPDQSVLYLAVADIEVDGQRLEGLGVAPTIAVERVIPFSAGHDPQREAGVAALTRILEETAAQPGVTTNKN
jgi:carboxyl-terminal processing protease